MNRTRRLILAVLGWTCCLAAGELSAQQQLQNQQQQSESSPMVSSYAVPHSGLNVNAKKRPARSSEAESNRTPTQSSPLTPIEERTYVAIIGAIKNPGVYQTQATSIPLQTLIERAGGESPESIGSIRIIERGITRFAISLRSAGNRLVMPGQIVYVAPRGGRQLRGRERQSAHSDCWIMVSGIAREPIRLNLNSEAVTLAELLNQFGQSPDLASTGQVVAVVPQGQWAELDTPLVNDTVVHIEPGAIIREGVLRAIQGGLNIQRPIDLDQTQEPDSLPSPAVQPGLKSAPTRETFTAPREKHSTEKRSTLLIPPTGMTPETPASQIPLSDNAEIERTGSSTVWPEPNLFPSSPRNIEEPEQPNGRTPILLPRDWTTPADDAPPSDEQRVINRTSAERRRKSGMIVTAAAEIEDSENSSRVDRSPTTTKTARQPSGTTSIQNELMPPFEESVQPATPWTTPQSWMVLSVVVAVALGSVLITRQLSKIEPTEAVFPETATSRSEVVTQNEPAAPPQESIAIPVSVEPEQDRFLQRLILNKVTLIEEKAAIEPSGQLHGQVVGSKRMVIHEAQPNAVGPHFRVRPQNDTRELELQLRRVMRMTPSPSPRAPHPAVAPPTRDAKTITVGALERALRTVDGGHR